MSKHPTKLGGFDTIKDAAIAVEGLRYDALATFLLELREAIQRRAKSDREAGRTKLAKYLDKTGEKLLTAACEMSGAWSVCAPYMKDDKK